MKRIFIPFILFICLLTSCKKDAIKDETCIELTNKENPPAQEFVPCNCSDNNEGGPAEYIRAEVNGVPVCADLVAQYGGYPFGNMLKYGKIIRDTGNTYYDNLYMIRHTKDQKFEFAIFLENTHALTKQYPYLLPRPNSEVCEIGELQLINMGNTATTSCFWCPTNDSHYYSQFVSNGLTFYAEKFANNVFEGRFEGTTRTGSGRVANIRNGSFRIKLTLLPSDIIVP